MSYPQVQFVASPDAGAAVRFDFHTGTQGSDGQTKVLHEGFSLGSPTLQGDPDGIGTEYGFRELSIPLRVNGTAATAAAKLSTLAREMGRQTNWLRFQASLTSPPYWFKTYRTSPVPLDWTQVRGTGPTDVSQWDVDVKLDAKDYAYGAQVTLPVVTINNNPAAGSNPCRVVLPEIVGDAPAPLRLRAVFSVAMHGHEVSWTSTPYAAGAAPAGPIVWQIGASDGWTAGTDTGASVADATFSGGSYRSVSFTTAAMTSRVRGVAPSSIAPGRYRVMLRVARSDTSSTFAFRLGQAMILGYGGYGDAVSMARPVSTAVGHATWVELGDHTFPFGAPDELDNPTNVTPDIDLQAQRLSGTGAARLDALLLIPVDVVTSDESTSLSAEFYGTGPNTLDTVIWDGDTESYQMVDLSSRAKPLDPPQHAGQFPMVTPDANNVLHLLQQTSLREGFFGDNSDDITATANLSMFYRPRWRYLAAS